MLWWEVINLNFEAMIWPHYYPYDSTSDNYKEKSKSYFIYAMSQIHLHFYILNTGIWENALYKDH